MKVLITGGAGYIGNELTYVLLNDTNIEQIIIYDNLSRKNYNLFLDSQYPKGKVKFVNGELLDSRTLRQVVDQVDVVYHLAAKVTTPFSSEAPHLFEQVNHWGTAELVYAIEKSNVKRVIYLSSTSVYGASDELVDIDTTPNPKTFYGSSKLRGGQHVKRLFKKMPAFITRCGNVYGYSPSARFDAVINRFMFEANFIGKIQITGNGDQYRAFIHIDKVVNVLHNLLYSNTSSGIYNLVDKNLSINQISQMVKEIYPKLEMIFINQQLALRQLKVKKDERLKDLMTLSSRSLKEELISFKEKFAFSSFE